MHTKLNVAADTLAKAHAAELAAENEPLMRKAREKARQRKQDAADRRAADAAVLAAQRAKQEQEDSNDESQTVRFPKIKI